MKEELETDEDYKNKIISQEDSFNETFEEHIKHCGCCEK